MTVNKFKRFSKFVPKKTIFMHESKLMNMRGYMWKNGEGSLLEATQQYPVWGLAQQETPVYLCTAKTDPRCLAECLRAVFGTTVHCIYSMIWHLLHRIVIEDTHKPEHKLQSERATSASSNNSVSTGGVVGRWRRSSRQTQPRLRPAPYSPASPRPSPGKPNASIYAKTTTLHTEERNVPCDVRYLPWLLFCTMNKFVQTWVIIQTRPPREPEI